MLRKLLLHKHLTMVQIIENAQLKEYNTFGISACASKLCIYTDVADIAQLIADNTITDQSNILVLGGGANMLFVNNFDGLVIHPQNSFIKIIDQDADYCYVEAGAGTNWDDFVAWAVGQQLGGVENLSLIPGTVGASPVQNIGAYGVEAKDSIFSVNVVNLRNGLQSTLSNSECKFGYRNSIFKNELKDQFLVHSVVYKLSRKPQFTTHYGSIQSEIEKLGTPTLETVRQAIINIRSAKLPDPKVTGNAGSFFKNPTISATEFEVVRSHFPDVVSYDAPNGMVKLAAGWLIDKCGLKGYVNSNGTAGVHSKQALVLVNLGGATGADILNLSNQVRLSVFNKFGINIEPEVIIL